MDMYSVCNIVTVVDCRVMDQARLVQRYKKVTKVNLQRLLHHHPARPRR